MMVSLMCLLALVLSSASMLVSCYGRYHMLVSFEAERARGPVECLPMAARGGDVARELKRAIMEVNGDGASMRSDSMEAVSEADEDEAASSSPAVSSRGLLYSDPRIRLAYLNRAYWSLWLCGGSFLGTSVPFVTLLCTFLLLANDLHTHVPIFVCLLVSLLLVGWKSLPIVTLPELIAEREHTKKLVWIDAWKRRQRGINAEEQDEDDSSAARSSSTYGAMAPSRTFTATIHHLVPSTPQQHAYVKKAAAMRHTPSAPRSKPTKAALTGLRSASTDARSRASNIDASATLELYLSDHDEDSGNNSDRSDQLHEFEERDERSDEESL
jgi:hypothetical protein